MKYLLTIIVILFSFGVFDASAHDDGVRITKSNAFDYMNWQTYRKCYLPGKRLFNAGIAMSSIGGAIFTLCIAVHVYNMFTWEIDPDAPEMYMIPLFASGVVLLNRTAERCNSGNISSPEVTFGPQSSGIGVGIRF